MKIPTVDTIYYDSVSTKSVYFIGMAIIKFNRISTCILSLKCHTICFWNSSKITSKDSRLELEKRDEILKLT